MTRPRWLRELDRLGRKDPQPPTPVHPDAVPALVAALGDFLDRHTDPSPTTTNTENGDHAREA